MPVFGRPLPINLCVLVCCGFLLFVTACGAGGTSTAAPQSLDLSGKWEFANGMNVNISQSGSSLSGTSVELLAGTSPSANTLQLQQCSPGAVAGSITANTVSMQSQGCGSTTATADSTGSALNGGNWGDAFKVATATGQYSGTVTFYDASGNTMGTSNVKLVVSEDQNRNLTGTLTVDSNTPVQLSGEAIGGVIDLNNGAVIGRVEANGAMQITVTPLAYGYCTYFGGCDAVGNGVVQ